MLTLYDESTKYFTRWMDKNHAGSQAKFAIYVVYLLHSGESIIAVLYLYSVDILSLIVPSWGNMASGILI